MINIRHDVCTICDKERMLFIAPFEEGKNYCRLCLFLRASLIEPSFENNGENPETTKQESFNRLREFACQDVFEVKGNAFEQAELFVHIVNETYAAGIAARQLCSTPSEKFSK